MIVKKSLFLGILLCFFGFAASDNDACHYLKNDQEAFEFCTRTPNTYVVVVWPLGSSSLHYIINTLNRYGSVKYVKSHSYNKKSMFEVYRNLHRSFSDSTAKKYFKSYVRPSWNDNQQLPVFSIVFHTTKSFKKLLKLKKEIRSHIGQSYFSIHINDKWNPETFQAAELLLRG